MSEGMDLARRAVACKHWRWMPGMATTTGIRISKLSMWDTDLPDLTDPATLGCLLALVREAHANPKATTYCFDVLSSETGYWGVALGETYHHAPTEAQALVAALETAP